MSKFKRRQNAVKKAKCAQATEAETGGQTGTRSTSPNLPENGFRESVVRDCTVLAQLMNDCPRSDGIAYHTSSVGITIIDMPKKDVVGMLMVSLMNSENSENISARSMKNLNNEVHRSRSVLFRFKD